MPINYMENIIENLLPVILQTYKDEHLSTCRKCHEDIKAIALNGLNPIYVTSEKGALYAKLFENDTQFNTDVVKKLVEAIEIVRQNPNHD